jgi:transcriptional regulator with XRE-family HTH domain
MNSQTPVPANVKALLAKIGNQLKTAREAKNLSREDVCQILKIHINSLIALEEGIFEELPGAAAFFASLRTYAKFLGLNAEELTQECKKNQFLFSALQGQGIIQRNNDSLAGSRPSTSINQEPGFLDKLPAAADQNPETNKTENASEQKNIWWKAVLVLLLVSALGLIAYFLYKEAAPKLFASGTCKPFKIIAKESTDLKIDSRALGHTILNRRLSPGEEISFSDTKGVELTITEPQAISFTHGFEVVDWNQIQKDNNLYVFECN